MANEVSSVSTQQTTPAAQQTIDLTPTFRKKVDAGFDFTPAQIAEIERQAGTEKPDGILNNNKELAIAEKLVNSARDSKKEELETIESCSKQFRAARTDSTTSRRKLDVDDSDLTTGRSSRTVEDLDEEEAITEDGFFARLGKNLLGGILSNLGVPNSTIARLLGLNTETESSNPLSDLIKEIKGLRADLKKSRTGETKAKDEEDNTPKYREGFTIGNGTIPNPPQATTPAPLSGTPTEAGAAATAGAGAAAAPNPPKVNEPTANAGQTDGAANANTGTGAAPVPPAASSSNAGSEGGNKDKDNKNGNNGTDTQ